MYETLNADLGIDACNLSDLTAEQVSCFLGQWEEGASIGTLTVFNNEKNILILNKDNEQYDTYQELAESYMGGSEETRKQLWEKCPNGMKDTLRVMEHCLKCRLISNELFRAEKNVIKSKPSWLVLDVLIKGCDSPRAVTIAFRYGMMQGKRMERVRKNRKMESI